MGNNIFAQRVKAEREKKNLSTTELAEKLGVQKSRVSMWETNGTIPRNDMLLKLCDFFNVTVDYLLGNETEQTDEKKEKINSIQRKLARLSPTDLDKAENVLDAVFNDVFRR